MGASSGEKGGMGRDGGVGGDPGWRLKISPPPPTIFFTFKKEIRLQFAINRGGYSINLLCFGIFECFSMLFLFLLHVHLPAITDIWF